MQFKTATAVLSALLLNGLVKSTPVTSVKSVPEVDYSVFPKEECTTEDCKAVSERVLSSLDTSVNPCEDFFQFSCGNWIKSHPLKDDEIATSGIILSRLEVANMLHNVIVGDYVPDEKLTPVQQKYDQETFQKIKNIYNTCMDVDAINQKGAQPLLDLLDDMEIYENRKRYATVEGFTDIITRLHEKAVYVLFDVGNVYLNNFSDKYTFVMIQNGSSMIGKYISLLQTEYKKYVLDTLKLVFENRPERNIEEMAEGIVAFETELATIINQTDSRKLYDEKEFAKNNMTLKDLKKKYPFFEWKMYMERMLKHFGADATVTNDTKIFNLSEDYFAALDDVMWRFSIDKLAYYIEWSVIRTFISYLPEKYSRPEAEFRYAITGQTEEVLKRDEFCETQVDNMLGMALGKYFVEKEFTEKTRENTSATITYIKQAMVNRIPQMTWLDEKTKESAIEKVLKMTNKIGFPEYILDPERLAKQYETFETSPDDYFTNMINYDSFSFGENVRLYQTVYDPSTWHMTPQTVNAYYYVLENSINFPAGIFKSSFYHEKDPDYMNYGIMGMVVGHELTHAFDNNGKNYDADGKKNNWWSQESFDKFEELSQCFVNQYSEMYVVDDNGEKVHGNGVQTLGENLADNGGMGRAFEAWLLSVEEFKKTNPELIKEHNPLLPGLSNYTYEQLFYISYGQGWCTNSRPAYDIDLIQNNEHAPPKFRVNGVVMNSEHFAKVFNCPVNTPMNPKDKCLIW